MGRMPVEIEFPARLNSSMVSTSISKGNNMETTSVKHIFEINKKAISDMVKIFGSNILSYGGRTVRITFSPEDEKVINVEHICQPKLRLTFEFRGNDYVVVYDNDMKRIASCSVYDSHGQTGRERVQQMVMEGFGIRIFLD